MKRVREFPIFALDTTSNMQQQQQEQEEGRERNCNDMRTTPASCHFYFILFVD